ncbi:MAG: hypothetical protein A3E31_05725 [Candidatus Rokubacteria bacterium RIFCSPHIGHO2_12_FULL_73_22]|nr:MAG: hypothetical protein A3D33_04820 [Candidatus Rokubacteria bacterium RIFCSPHIGHO2_02_FULL_73_26]OGL00854.1 MAG: hypothetical protein A3E31_05725 [Candidatus Rokubacteria bacterium RIFCSPHIGHO2_12_FULL_73_22]OGL11870.1 MAG: hypothetical protein A3I14_05440 [Candidatus Rokubacteria bacterium RIFCSPLOWO2_02_FULL_73_56]OGL28229.1 MAG: hypothetical protein A3G44_12540 [Candidatus Rokubacteria bacterium RIFCSPLOWO2_12_FULL_73_47]
MSAARAGFLAALLLLGPAPVRAASLAPGAAERAEALRVGARSVTQETFDREWRVRNASGDRLTVITPFHRLVLAARHAAFKNEKLKPGEPDRILREQGERVVIWASLHGPRPDFARYYAPRLVAGDREIEPSFVQNERTAMRQDTGRYLARSVYGFPVRDLDGKSRLELVIRDPDGRDVGRFTIDLAAMR